MEILERFYCLIYTFAWLGLLDWLESSGAFERVFKRPMAYWHGVVLLLIFVALAVVLPDIVNGFIGVALLFLYIGYKIGCKRK